MNDLRKTYFVAVLLLCSLSFINAVTSVDKDTYLLMSFEDKIKVLGMCAESPVKIVGAVESGMDGKCGKAIKIGNRQSGLSVELNKIFPLKSGIVVLEAWIYLEEYPKSNAYIAEKVYESNRPKLAVKPEKAGFGFGLYITPDGTIANDYTSVYYGKRRSISGADIKIPLKKWTHIAVMNAGFPTNRIVIFIDNRRVVDMLQEFEHRLSFNAAPEDTAPGRFIVGNNEKFDSGFPGLINEVRMYTQMVNYSPPPDNSFIDPAMKRPEIQNEPPYFMDGHKPVVHLSFDTDNFKDNGIQMHMEPAKTKVVDGVRGRGFQGKILSIEGKKIIEGVEGTIEFWMKPDGWSNFTIKNKPLFSANIFTWYVFNNQSDPRPLSLYFKDDLDKIQFLNMPASLHSGAWVHVAITWKDGRFRGYFNGSMLVENLFQNINKFRSSSSDSINFFSGDTVYDEVRIYKTELTSPEVWNSYVRYVAQDKLRDFSGYEFKINPYPGLGLWVGTISAHIANKPALADIIIKDEQDQIVMTRQEKLGDVRFSMTPDENKDYRLSDFVDSLSDLGFAIPTGGLPDGNLKVNVTLKDTDNKELAHEKDEIKKVKWEWLGTRLGKSCVPPPYSPLKLTTLFQNGKISSADNCYKLSTAMADFTFDNKGLISQMSVNGGELLNAPICFLGQAGNKTAIQLQYSIPVITVDEGGRSARIIQKVILDKILIQVAAVMEFDGFIKYEFKLGANSDTQLDFLELRIPLRAENAMDYYVLRNQMDHAIGGVPDTAGEFFNSIAGKFTKRHELPIYGGVEQFKGLMTYGNFKPYAWVGCPHRGIAYMADNDKGWIQNEKIPALSFSRESETVYLHLKLIAEPTVLNNRDKMRTIVLSLIPTPVKTTPAGFHLWQTTHHFAVSDGGRLLGNEKLQALYPADYAKSRIFADQAHQRNLKVLPSSIINEIDKRTRPFAYFKNEWLPANYPQYGTGSLIDFNTYMLHDWIIKCGIDGIYVDNVYPQLDYVLEPVGAAYRHEKGGIQPGYQLFAYREYIKRLYCMMAGDLKLPVPRTQVHMTHAQMAPISSFTDIA